MLAALARRYPSVLETFAEASARTGLDLWRLAQQGPEEELNITTHTQPALLAGGVAVWRCWQERGGAPPAYLAGHSLGEYTALVCAGALSFSDAAALVAERAHLMQEAVPAGAGAMTAILGLPEERIEEICRRPGFRDVVAPANYNAPGQVVLSGQAESVAEAAAAAREVGARRTLRLPVGVPSHCPLMRPAAARLARVLEAQSWLPPRIPVLHNVDAGICADPAALPEALSSQLYLPVRWTETVQRLVRQGVQRVLEFGPGRVLAGLCRRIDRRLEVLSVEDPDSLERALEAAGA